MAAIKPAAMWPLTISAGVNDKIDLLVGATPYTATIAAATYYSLPSLATALQAALTAAVANTWGVGWSGIPAKINITGASAFTLKWGTGANAAVGPRLLLGWTAADTSSAAAQTAPNQHQNAWYADDPVADDTGDLPVYVRSQGRALAGRMKSLHFATQYVRTVRLAFLLETKVFKALESTKVNEAIERLFESGWARFRWFPDQTDLNTGTDYVLELDAAKALPRDRLSAGAALYSVTLPMSKYV